MSREWKDRRKEYEEKVAVALEEANTGLGLGILWARFALHVDFEKDGHHRRFDPHVLSITELFINVISRILLDPLDETTWHIVRAAMEKWPGNADWPLAEYHVTCDASNNPCTLVDANAIRATFVLKLGRFTQFSLTALPKKHTLCRNVNGILLEVPKTP